MSVNTTLHFDIVSGIAGDMVLAILNGMGLDMSEVSDIVNEMTGRQITVTPEKTFVNGIESIRLKINVPHEHAHRRMSDIRSLIERAPVNNTVKDDAIGIFEIIAEAEAEIHGRSVEDVHFHEVGALDSILDIVGVAYGINKLGISKITSSTPVLGCGTVKCAHGDVPVPAPATLKILEGVDVVRTNEPNELTTPTGAAILKYYVQQFSSSYSGKILASVHSTGTKTLETMPNILRGTLIENAVEDEQVTVIETNIDDCSGEVIGSLFEKMNGCTLDFFCSPVTGKKNRPAMKLTALCSQDQLQEIAEILFKETSTAGLRYYSTSRIIMDRSFLKVCVENTEISVKKLTYGDIKKFSPEWDDCTAASAKTGKSAMEIYNLAIDAASKSEF